LCFNFTERTKVQIWNIWISTHIKN
jgi:hypothetical protein